jgi:hypothetical protein
MKMAVPAHRRDENVPTRTAHATGSAAPRLQLASLIGNHAMRRLIERPVVQRGLWDDITGAASQVSEWLGGGGATAQEPPAVDAPMSHPGVTDEGLQPAHEPAFQDVLSPSENHGEANANEATDAGSWVENWFGQQE